MTDYEKKGHPVLGIILGAIGIIVAVTLVLVTGVVGGGVALVLGVIALLLGIGAVKGGKKGGGIGSIVVGAIAILLAVVMTFSTVTLFREMQKRADENIEKTPLMAKYLKDPYMGFLGMVLNMSKDNLDEAKAEDLRAEMDYLSNVIQQEQQK